MTLLNLASIEPAFFIVFSLCLGLIVGSFLNVVIHRLPKMMESEFRHECAVIDLPEDAEEPARPRYNLAVPRSACPGCGALITARDNIPVLSWLWLRGRCRHCQTAISPRYPLVELTTGLLTAAMAWHFGPSLLAVGAILLVWFLVALFCIDADTYLLPDSLTLPLLWLGLLFNLNGIFVPLQDAVVGAMAGYLLLWLVYWAFKLVTGKDGMGYGDFKLLAALGAWMGWQCLPVIILMSSVAGAIIGISLTLLARRGWGKPLPFGPYLAIAGLATLFWGPQLQRLIWGAY
ncbi:type 4 prepilin-like proteins leader peptide-processing enzyme [Chitinimonas prasina]|uniref:Prepilin leader peptidase/N-methyltransferase n=1 Tax=Chitinimonas prasina TaxID=1434937 RepID=A0ABQ5YJK4_9NEIS|nr:A24 family peptidase [Chitinimonas prasina]GLR14119.1 type 4 prepilin-like proteins leader peptide-processing enzyme [Chitinimonas prasina]